MGFNSGMILQAARPAVRAAVVTRFAGVAAALIGLTAPAAALASAPAARPNIVVILSDDAAWKDFGFQGGEHPTPRIDRLAKEGVRLTQFYVQPLCTPTRSALLTGRYPFRTATRKRFRTTGGMPEEERTLAEALADVSYQTAIVGKWHLGNWEKRFLPMAQGFQHQYGCYNGVIDYFTKKRGRIYDWHRDEQPLQEEGYVTDLIAAEAARWIRMREGDEPFFLYVPFTAVHVPYRAPEADIAAAEARGRKRHEERPLDEALYEAMLARLDAGVGEVLDALEESGLSENTLVVFFNDNGRGGEASNAPLRSGKSSFYEGGIRVPAVLSWPAGLQGGRVLDEMVHVVDLYTTLLKLAGGRLDESAQPLPLDGLDLWPMLTRGGASPRSGFPIDLKAIREGDWKYIAAGATYYKWRGGAAQLYDLATDPGEKRNLVDEHPERVAELQARLDAHAAAKRPVPRVQKLPKSARIYGEEEARSFRGFPSSQP